MTTLRNLQPGQRGWITAVTAGGETGRRLGDLGLLPGARVWLDCLAPLRDPLAVRLDGVKLALRRVEADCVGVRLETQTEASTPHPAGAGA